MTTWRKSSYSGSATDEACIEVAQLEGGIGVRDSKAPHGPHLVITAGAFGLLLEHVRHLDGGPSALRR
ncbi:DUF397 domain-containing protein [Actinomadura barringtoniae]|uniref:DUF397 domain-containing protein n=1 Tax=Actinomadura barringtoniae TaxID=1427535 RepID=A0A939T5R6_9ACTN|nr:DUF397 domain-containing protein [Actinomadura barringtoniae]MBO2447427.1 DUF397 domain-containing protein [Actinomadura barringtoniae]